MDQILLNVPVRLAALPCLDCNSPLPNDTVGWPARRQCLSALWWLTSHAIEATVPVIYLGDAAVLRILQDLLPQRVLLSYAEYTHNQDRLAKQATYLLIHDDHSPVELYNQLEPLAMLSEWRLQQESESNRFKQSKQDWVDNDGSEEDSGEELGDNEELCFAQSVLSGSNSVGSIDSSNHNDVTTRLPCSTSTGYASASYDTKELYLFPWACPGSEIVTVVGLPPRVGSSFQLKHMQSQLRAFHIWVRSSRDGPLLAPPELGNDADARMEVSILRHALPDYGVTELVDYLSVHLPGRVLSARRLVPRHGLWYDRHETACLRRELNPPLRVEPVLLRDYKGGTPSAKTRAIQVIDESSLPGGTLQRVLLSYFLTVSQSEIVYAAPEWSPTLHSVAFVGQVMDKAVVLFTGQNEQQPHPATKAALNHDPCLFTTPLRQNMWLRAAHLYRDKDRAQRAILSLDDDVLLEFGVESLRALDLPPNPPRLWLTYSNPLLLRILYRLFPGTVFLVVTVAPVDHTRAGLTRLGIAQESYRTVWFNHHDLEAHYMTVPENERPPYPSCGKEDAKLWNWVLEYALTSDYVWNSRGSQAD